MIEIVYKNRRYTPEVFAIEYNFSDINEAVNFMSSLVSTGRAQLVSSHVSSDSIYNIQVSQNSNSFNKSQAAFHNAKKNNYEEDVESWDKDDLKEYYGYDRNDSDDVL